MAWPWPLLLAFLAAFVLGVGAGFALARFSPSSERSSRTLENPAAIWKSMTQHEISFLQRIWRVGFILEEDETLWRGARPEVVNATLHDLVDNRRLAYLDRVRSAQRLRAYRLTAAGKTLMTWVTNAGR